MIFDVQFKNQVVVQLPYIFNQIIILIIYTGLEILDSKSKIMGI